MTKYQLAFLTEAYWKAFTLTDEELKHLYGLILKDGMPQTTNYLVYEVVERRCQAEAEATQEECARQRVVPYDPRETFREGQRLLFTKFGIARVTATWPQYDPYFGENLGMRVREEATGKMRVFKAGIKRGFEYFVPAEVEEPEDWDLGKPTPYVTPGEVVEQFGSYVQRELLGRLSQDERFINFGQEWFLVDLLERVSPQELAQAAERIRQAGEPLSLKGLADVPDKPQTQADFVQRFRWNYALARDNRFDNVGTSDAPLWFLAELEPPEVVTKPKALTIPAVPYSREYIYVHRELKELDRRIAEEEEGSHPLGEPESAERVEFVLNFAHRQAGAIPLNKNTRRVFPRTDRPRTRITFINGRSGERMPGWVMWEENYAWGLREWYEENLIWPGAYIRLERTEHPLELIVDYIPLPEPKTENVRVPRIVDGKLTFEWQERTIPYKYDPDMLIAETRFEDMEALGLEARYVGMPIFEVMCEIFPGLAQLHPQGHVHARTLFSAVNLVRRCAPGTVFCELSQRVCFDPVGGGYWTYDESLRDVKVVYDTPQHMETRPQSRRHERVKSYVTRRIPVQYKAGEFEGFLDTDFQDGVTGTHWRAELGHTLRDLLSQEYAVPFKSDPPYRWPEVYFYHEGHDVIYKHAKFYVRLDSCFCQPKTGPFDHRKEGHFGHLV